MVVQKGTSLSEETKTASLKVSYEPLEMEESSVETTILKFNAKNMKKIEENACCGDCHWFGYESGDGTGVCTYYGTVTNCGCNGCTSWKKQ